ncbi:MAG: hypothetical protein RLZZ328_1375 [Bacteroidota bacterium]|jgi:hypothetical protein
MSRLVEILFKWRALRNAIFAEVDWYNSITRTIQDPESMKTGSAFWCEEDGWRGWTQQDNGVYYFHDVPEKSISDMFEIFFEKEKK